MSLNKIELQDVMLGELYRGNLLATDGPARLPKPAPTATGPAKHMQPPLPSPPPPAIATAKPKNELSAEPAAAAPAATAPPDAHPAPSTAARAATPAPPPAGYKFLGKNNRNITIIVQSPGIAFLPDDQLNFLSKMLEACKMNMADVAIVNHAVAPVRIATAKTQLQPSFLLLFGLGPVDIGLPMDFPQFKIQAYDQCSYLSAPPLGDLLIPGDDAKLLKSKLWVSLKTMFGI